MLSTLHESGKIPMPAPLWFDPTGEELGSPGIVIEMVDGEALVSLGRKVDPSELPGFAPRLAEVGGALAAFPVEEAPACLEVPASWDDYIDSRIQYWVDAERRHVDRDPFMRLIASYLQANRPPPVPLGLVHGDFQIANVLIGDDGNDVLVDWELTHIGDPREDLGWCMMASVTQPPDVVGADEEAFYARYREISGLTEEQVNPATTDYFLLLASSTVFVGVTRAARRAGPRARRPASRSPTCRPPSPGCTTCSCGRSNGTPRRSGGATVISRPTTQQLIDAICVELGDKVAPAITDPVRPGPARDGDLRCCRRPRCAAATSWRGCSEERDAIEQTARQLLDALPDATALRRRRCRPTPTA